MKIELMAQVNSDLAKIAGRQAPFITAMALSRTAIGARDLVRANLPKRFTIRNSWTRGGIQARTATKTNLVAQVLAPGYMAIQETGGTRSPTASKTLAAPGDALQGPTVIPRAKRPRALLAGDNAFLIRMRDGNAAIFQRIGPKKGQIELLYWLTRTQDYNERFRFEEDVTTHTRTQFQANFAAEWAKVMGK